MLPPPRAAAVVGQLAEQRDATIRARSGQSELPALRQGLQLAQVGHLRTVHNERLLVELRLGVVDVEDRTSKARYSSSLTSSVAQSPPSHLAPIGWWNPSEGRSCKR